MRPTGSDEDHFSTDTMKTSILDIQKDAVSQQMLLINLKQKRLDLENDIKRKVVELNQAKEEQLVLEGQLQSSELRLEELHKYNTQGENNIAELRKNAQNIMDCCNKEKELQLTQLKDYETRMAELSQMVSNGPKLYDRDTLSSEFASLRTQRVYIHEELASIERDMNKLRVNLANLVSHNTEFPSSAGDLVDLSSALKFILCEVKSSTYEADCKRLQNEIKTLQQVTSELKFEIKGKSH